MIDGIDFDVMETITRAGSSSPAHGQRGSIRSRQLRAAGGAGGTRATSASRRDLPDPGMSIYAEESR